jgi:hypothetical protein
VLDLGSITWRSHTDTYVSRQKDGEFTYAGIDLDAFFADTSGASEVFDHLLDTLESAFGITQKHGAYVTGLPLQSYLGLAYVADPRNAFHLVGHSLRFDGRTHVDLSVSYVRRLGRWFAVSPGLTYVGQALHPGLGTVLSLGSFQFYLVTDNVYGVFYPQRARNVDVRGGLNFVVGRSR